MDWFLYDRDFGQLKLKIKSCIFDKYSILKSEQNFSPRIFNKETRNNTRIIYFNHYVVKGVKFRKLKIQLNNILVKNDVALKNM